MRIAVIGIGYVGLVTGTCLAHIGHEVVCTDCDLEKINSLRSGVVPFYEQHLQQVMQLNVGAGRLHFTDDPADAVRFADSIFICVGTPPLNNGDADLSAIERVARTIANHAHESKLVIEKSTVPVRTGERLERALTLYARQGVKLHVASNPEFLREGNALLDFLHPSRIVVGVNDANAEQQLRQIYAAILQNTFTCPLHRDGCGPSATTRFLTTSVNSAELIKHASNSFLAMKISYANLVAQLCEEVGADVEQVTIAMGLDSRIGSDFLHAGLGFGGFCFPKDIQAFIRLGEKAGIDVGLLKETERLNRRVLDRFVELIQEVMWTVDGKRFALLGLSFKPGTDDTRCSPALAIAKRLLQQGGIVCAYDPKALDRATVELPQIEAARDEYEAAANADAVIIATEWPQFAQLDWRRVQQRMARPLLFDGRNQLSPEQMHRIGFEYYSIGRPGVGTGVEKLNVVDEMAA